MCTIKFDGCYSWPAEARPKCRRCRHRDQGVAVARAVPPWPVVGVAGEHDVVVDVAAGRARQVPRRTGSFRPSQRAILNDHQHQRLPEDCAGAVAAAAVTAAMPEVAGLYSKKRCHPHSPVSIHLDEAATEHSMASSSEEADDAVVTAMYDDVVAGEWFHPHLVDRAVAVVEVAAATPRLLQSRQMGSFHCVNWRHVVLASA